MPWIEGPTRWLFQRRRVKTIGGRSRLRQYQIYKEPTPVTRNWQAQKTLIPPCWKCFQEHRIDAVNLDFGLCRSRCLLTYVRQTQRDKQAPLFGALDQDPDTD